LERIMKALALVVLLLSQEAAPPALVSVTCRADPTEVVLVFTKPVDASSAESASNYSIDNDVKVESASRGLDLRTVTLGTSPLSEGVPYTVRVKNVVDCSTPPVAVAAGTLRTFTYARGLFGGASAREEPHLKVPKLSRPLLFNTPEADALLAGLQVFPKNNPWNEDISRRPVHPDSERMIAAIGREKTMRVNFDMAFVLVPPNQPRVEVKILSPSESDRGPYPLPDNAPIEGWPLNGKTLEDAQQGGGADEDRHSIVLDPASGMLYEFYRLFKRPAGWEANGEATFDLKSNRMRPRRWTSSDAAGLPLFAALPRFDECERGLVGHALRVTVSKTRREFLYPATHQAGSTDSPLAPAMGQRFRLRAGVDISGFPKHAQAIAAAMKKHGLFVADNGHDWDVSVPPDSRLKGLESLRKLKGSDFEVVVPTGENDLGR
jgi:hypothetical protein